MSLRNCLDGLTEAQTGYLTELQCAAGLGQRPRDIQQFLNRDKISSCQMTTDYSEQ